jgi:hypothetical protein
MLGSPVLLGLLGHTGEMPLSILVSPPVFQLRELQGLLGLYLPSPPILPYEDAPLPPIGQRASPTSE